MTATTNILPIIFKTLGAAPMSKWHIHATELRQPPKTGGNTATQLRYY